jgi:hypothetical protein
MNGNQINLCLRDKACMETRSTFVCGTKHEWKPDQPLSAGQSMNGNQIGLCLQYQTLFFNETMFTFKAQKPITLNTPLLTDKNYTKVGLYTHNWGNKPS